MATKDWKKQKSYRNQYAWKKNGTLLIVMKDNLVVPYWHFLVNGMRRQHFKTKQKALAYAKAYMRKN